MASGISDMFTFDNIADDAAKERRGMITDMMTADATKAPDTTFKQLPGEPLQDYAARTNEILKQMRIRDSRSSPFQDMQRYMNASPNTIYGH